tara:strand:- start:272 stop:457 length:186 start_codon:yes stop_codon:yes gene_type:complete
MPGPEITPEDIEAYKALTDIKAQGPATSRPMTAASPGSGIDENQFSIPSGIAHTGLQENIT